MTLEERIAQFLRDSCPSEEGCLEDEEACFKEHPIHRMGSEDKIDSIYADVDGAAKLLAGFFFAELVVEVYEMFQDKRLLESPELQESLRQAREGEGRTVYPEDSVHPDEPACGCLDFAHRDGCSEKSA